MIVSVHYFKASIIFVALTDSFLGVSLLHSAEFASSGCTNFAWAISISLSRADPCTVCRYGNNARKRLFGIFLESKQFSRAQVCRTLLNFQLPEILLFQSQMYCVKSEVKSRDGFAEQFSFCFFGFLTRLTFASFKLLVVIPRLQLDSNSYTSK